MSDSRVRGRIASVLASARASLQEPQRPVTPGNIKRERSISNSHLNVNISSSSSSTSFHEDNTSIIYNNIKLHSLRQIKSKISIEDERNQILFQEINECIHEITQFIHEENTTGIYEGLLNIFQYHKQIQIFCTLENINSFVNLLFSILKNKMYEVCWILCHFHLIKVFIYSQEIQSTTMMSFIYTSFQNIYSRWNQEIDRLFEMKNEIILQIGLECILDIFQLFALLRPVIQIQLHSEWRNQNLSQSHSKNEAKGDDNNDEYEDNYVIFYVKSVALCINILRLLSPYEEGRKRLCVSCGLLENDIILNLTQSYIEILSSLNTSSFSSSSSKYSNEFKAVNDKNLIRHQMLTYFILSNGLLRDILSDSACKKKLLRSNMFSTLSEQLSLVGTCLAQDSHFEVLLSMLRVASRVSLQEGFRQQINGKKTILAYYFTALSYLANALKTMNLSQLYNGNDEKYIQSPPPTSLYYLSCVSRLAFVLGNLTTTNSENRVILGTHLKIMQPLWVLLQGLSTVFMQEYLNLADNDQIEDCEEYDVGIERETEETGGKSAGRSVSTKETISALVSLLRLQANLCIEGELGRLAGQQCTLLETLLDILSCCANPSQFEDLALNTIAAITNLTYYTCGCDGRTNTPTDESFQSVLANIAKHLLVHVNHENEEVVLEAAKALGNLSRSAYVLDDLIEEDAYTKLLALVFCQDSFIVEATLGIFINASGHAHSRVYFLSPKQDLLIVRKLLSLLRRTALKSIVASTLICKVLFNLLSQNIRPPSTPILWDVPLLEGLSMTLFELIDCVEELRTSIGDDDADAGGDSKEEKKETTETIANYKRFYLTATSLYELIDGEKYVCLN